MLPPAGEAGAARSPASAVTDEGEARTIASLGLSFSLITRFAGASPAGGSTTRCFCAKREAERPLWSFCLRLRRFFHKTIPSLPGTIAPCCVIALGNTQSIPCGLCLACPNSSSANNRKRLMEEAPEPERFPVLHRLPLWCASSLACTFRSPVLIRSFCLRVFAFPFGSAVRGLSRVIHPGHIRFFRLFLYRRHKKRRIRSAVFCILSVCSPLFAVKCFFAGREGFEASRRG